MWVIVASMNQHQFLKFEPNNPPVNTLWKSDTPISPQNAHYMKKNLLFVKCFSFQYIILYVFLVDEFKNDVKKTIGWTNFFYKIENNP